MRKIIKYFLPFMLFALPGLASAAIAEHVVISQIQTDSTPGSGGISDDFIELYNPTSAPVFLSTWSVQRRNLAGTLAKIDLTGIIPARGFYLIVRGSATTSLTSLADKTFSLGIAFNSGDAFLLVNNTTTVESALDADIIDLVGMGANAWFETATGTNPSEGQVLLRKSGSTHTAGQGNGWDTNNNANDFILNNPNPRNTLSPTKMPPPPPPPPPSPEPPPPPTLSELIRKKIHARLEELFNNIFQN